MLIQCNLPQSGTPIYLYSWLFGSHGPSVEMKFKDMFPLQYDFIGMVARVSSIWSGTPVRNRQNIWGCEVLRRFCRLKKSQFFLTPNRSCHIQPPWICHGAHRSQVITTANDRLETKSFSSTWFPKLETVPGSQDFEKLLWPSFAPKWLIILPVFENDR